MARERAFSIGKIPEDKKFGGQAALILDSLRKNHPQTVKSVAGDIKAKLQTRQDPERVVAFYMSTWKKKGIVTATEVEVPDTEGKASTASKKKTETDDEEADEDDDDDTENGAVQEERLSMDQRVELHEELSAAEPSPGGKFDGMRATDAVKAVLKMGKLTIPADIEMYLQEHGYPVKKGTVQASLANLVRMGAARRDASNNTYTAV
jgi:hypothetical protein